MAMENENTQVKINKQILEEAIRNPGNEFPDLKEYHDKMTNALQNMVQETDRLYTKDEKGKYPLLDKNTHKRMVELYKNAINAVDDYKTKIQEKGEKNPDQKAVTEPIAGLMDRIEELMGKDFKVLLFATRRGIKTLPDVILCARTKAIDLGVQNTTMAGEVMSSRMQIKVPGENGEQVEGFFTPSEENPPDKWDEFDQARDRLKEKTREIVGEDQLKIIIDHIANQLKRNPSYSVVRQLEEKTCLGDKEAESPDEIFKNMVMADLSSSKGISSKNISEEELDNLFDGTGLSQMLGEYFPEIFRIRIKHAILDKDVQLDSKKAVDRRNSAMSDIAQLLGMGDLLAYSTPMVIRKNGKIVKGTFMEKAKGYDVKIPNMASVFADPNVNVDYNSPELKRQLADLQILDFICGNVDRHNGNMVYQFAQSKRDNKIECVGIQGIDNDSSFGKITDGVNRLPKLAKIQAVTENTALVVSHLSPAVLKTTLRNYNFSEKEINAAITRMQKIQDAIKSKNIKVISDKEWENVDATKLGGYFEKIRDLKEEHFYRLQTAFYEENTNNFMRRYKEFYWIKKPLEPLNQIIEDADKDVWNGSREFKNVRKYLGKMVDYYYKAKDVPTNVKNLTKMRRAMEKVMENAQAYEKSKENKKLNDKERRRLNAIKKVLEVGETQLGSIAMLEKCSMQRQQISKFQKKSFRTIASDFLSVMQKNIKKYPEGSQKKEQGEKALTAMGNLIKMAKKGIYPDVNTQRVVQENIADIMKYDPDLMNKTELTYAYGTVGTGGRKKKVESTMDIVTFLHDVAISEQIKAPQIDKRVQEDMKREQEMNQAAERAKKEQEMNQAAETAAMEQKKESTATRTTLEQKLEKSKNAVQKQAPSL